LLKCRKFRGVNRENKNWFYWSWW